MLQNEMDFEIVIAHHGMPFGLWATIRACENELRDSGYKYAYRICVNGDGDGLRSVQLYEIRRLLLETLKKQGKLGAWVQVPEALSPPSARNRAAQGATGRYLFFFDDHCIPNKGYFARALQDFQTVNADMIHSVTRWFSGEEGYHYNLNLEHDFWVHGTSAIPYNWNEPYRIAVGGHGGWAIRTDVWDEVGRYWEGFTGWGGEECYFDLKMALLDKTNYFDPLLVHDHYTSNTSNENRGHNDDHYRSMMMSANIIGGEKWLFKVYKSFTNGSFVKTESGKQMFDLLAEAQKQSREHAEWMAANRKRTLDEQLAIFSANNVPY